MNFNSSAVIFKSVFCRPAECYLGPSPIGLPYVLFVRLHLHDPDVYSYFTEPSRVAL